MKINIIFMNRGNQAEQSKTPSRSKVINKSLLDNILDIQNWGDETQ